MSNSESIAKLNRREALLLSATAGVAALAGTSCGSGGSKLQHASNSRCEHAIRKGAQLCRGWRPDFQRRPVWREHGGRKPVASKPLSEAAGRAAIQETLREIGCKTAA